MPFFLVFHLCPFFLCPFYRAPMGYTVSKQIICLRLRKNAIFRVITELTENLVRVKRTIIDTLLSEQFSALGYIASFFLKEDFITKSTKHNTKNSVQLYAIVSCSSRSVCCVVTRSILKPTDAITKEYRQELYEMQIFCQILHISGSVKGPLSYKHNLLDMELFLWEYLINHTLQN